MNSSPEQISVDSITYIQIGIACIISILVIELVLSYRRAKSANFGKPPKQIK